MTSPAEDRSQKAPQTSAPEAKEGLSHAQLPLVKDQSIILDHRYLNGLHININFNLNTDGGVQAISVVQLHRNGEPTGAGFFLEHIPADLQIALSPETVAKRPGDEYLRHIVYTLEYFNRTQQQSGTEPINFQPLVTVQASNEQGSEQDHAARLAVNQRCIELGFEPPSPSARPIINELTSFVQTSHQPPSLEAWSHGTQHTKHTVTTHENLDDNYETLSQLSIALAATNDTIDRYVRTRSVRRFNGNTDLVERDSTHRYNYPTEAGALKFYEDTYKLIEILIADGMASTLTWLSQLSVGKVRHSHSGDNNRQQTQLPSGVLVQLESSYPRIEIFRDPYANHAAIIVKPPFSSHTHPFTVGEIHHLYEVITSNRPVDWSEVAHVLYDEQFEIYFNPKAELSPGLTQFHKALERGGHLEGLEWVQGEGALSRPTRQIREFLEGREAVLIKREDITKHGFSDLHIIFKGDTLDQIFIKSREDWVLDFHKFNLSPVDRHAQTEWLVKLTDTFRNDPFQAIVLLQETSREHDSSFYGRPATENIPLLKNMSALYESALQYGCKTGVASLARLYMTTFNPKTNSARVNLMAKGRHLLSFEFDKDGVTHIQVSHRYILNLWRPRLEGRYEIPPQDMKPAELFDLVVDHFASFTNQKRPFAGSGFKVLLESIGVSTKPR